MSTKLRKIQAGKFYVFIKDYRNEYWPCLDEAKKGDVVKADVPNLGLARFYHTEKKRRNQQKHPLILMKPKEAFEYLEEYNRVG